MATDRQIEQLLRQVIQLQHLANEFAGQAETLIEVLFGEIAAALVRLDPTGVQLRYRQGRLEQLTERVKDLSREHYDRLYKAQREELAGLGAFEANHAALQLRSVLGAGAAGKVAATTGLGPSFFKAVVDEKPLEGALLRDWFRQQERTTVFRIGQQIQLGMISGDSIGDMVRRIRGTASGPPIRDERGRITGHKFVGGVMATSTREATAIVRTAVNQISNAARFEALAAQPDITEEYDWISTLDSRTTPICQARDGQRFRYNDPEAPKPPAHIGCRSAIAPVVAWEKLGLKPPPEGTRASMDGQVPAGTNYEQWLYQQGPKLQDEILGPGRAQLFREKRISLREMVATDGRRVTLAELRRIGTEDATGGGAPLPARSDREKAGLPRSFADVSEAEKWASERYPHIAWELTGADPKALIPTLAQFDKLAREWPEVAGRLRYVGTYEGEAWKAAVPRSRGAFEANHAAHAAHNGTYLGLNPEAFGDSASYVRRLFETTKARKVPGYPAPVTWNVPFQEGRAFEYLITHEWGHLVDSWLRAEKRAAVAHVGVDGTGLVGEMWGWWRHRIKMDARLSEYATFNEFEMIAEAFAALYETAPSAAVRNLPVVRELKEWLDLARGHSSWQRRYGLIDDVPVGLERAKVRADLDRLRRRLGVHD